MRRLLKKVWISLAVLIICFAVFSSIFRSLTPWVKQYKGEVEHYLTQVTGQPVAIQKMETGWYWFHPVLKLHQVKLGRDEDHSLIVGKFYIGINLFKSLLNWRIQPGVLYLEDLHLVLRQNKKQWNVDGAPSLHALDNDNTFKQRQLLLAWIANQERLIVKKVSLFFYFENGGLIPVQDLNLSIVHRNGHYKIKGDAQLKQTNETSFELLGNLDFNIQHLQKTKGHFYFSAKNIEPAQWQSLIPKKEHRLQGGTGDFSLWVDLNKGAISGVQAQGDFKNLVWHPGQKSKRKIIQHISANLSWEPKNKGWQLLADHVQLRTGGISWPENQLSVTYDRNQNSHQFFIKTLILESLLDQPINWPSSLEKFIGLKPHGVLDNTQILIKENNPAYVLTRFDHLGWQGQGSIPKIDDLSGVLNWQPSEGRLELDSEHVLVHEPGYPQQDFKLLNAAFDWKELSHGMRLSIERFALSQADLTVTAEGVLDQVGLDSLGNMQLIVEFSVRNLQHYIPLIPKKIMKAKLYEWLTHDLKKIEKATGKLILNGLAKDFPFDQGPGVFSINSHAIGGELQVNSQWPLIKDIEAYIRLKNRDLNIDVINADFQGIPVKQMNVRIDDIGHDRENLLIHGIIWGTAQKMMDYVLATPVKKRLKMLQMLTMEGLALLNLRVEVPLYPENDNNLVQGELTFKNNNIKVKHPIKEISLEEVTGRLSFDEKGITQSALFANALGSPLTIKILSSDKPQASTSIAVHGTWSIDTIKDQLNWSGSTWLKGKVPVDAAINLSSKTEDIDTINLKSSLKGLAINLPKPLGKDSMDSVPTEVDLNFNTKDLFQLKAQQKSKDIVVHANIHSDKLWSFHVEQKNILADLTYNRSDYHLSGLVKRLHLEQGSFLDDEKKWTASMYPGQIPNLNVRINQFSMGSINVGDITLKSHSTAEKWLIDSCEIDSPVYQFRIAGDWTKNDQKNLTQLELKLYLKNLAKSLERWSLLPVVDADKGLLEFRGNWKGPIYNFSLPTLNGDLSLQLNHGRITHLSPETEEKLGLGKLLSILSLQTIPRRLKLDFSDLSHQGYSFDIFKGNFTINQGIMRTEDSYIEGPVAYGSMKGDLDLVKRMYDLDLSISPHITASLPLVATIAGGPLAGLAVWVANNIINQSMQKISAYTYKISGPWKDPVVQQLTIIKKKN